MQHLSLQDVIVISPFHTQCPEIAYVFEMIAADLLDQCVMDLMAHLWGGDDPWTGGHFLCAVQVGCGTTGKTLSKRQDINSPTTDIEENEAQFGGWFKGATSLFIIVTSGL